MSKPRPSSAKIGAPATPRKKEPLSPSAGSSRHASPGRRGQNTISSTSNKLGGGADVKGVSKPPEIKGGRVRVTLRVRPQTRDEEESQAERAVEVEPETSSILLRRNQWDEDTHKFDAVFQEQSAQQRVYETVALPVVESVMKGYNGTIMAYGQTGTGKTFTLGHLGVLENGEQDPSLKGIMVRAVDTIFHEKEMDEEGDYKVQANFLQLYNEQVQDLWDTKTKDISITEDRQTGEVILEPKPASVDLKDSKHIVDLLQQGEKNRAVANHKLNAHSSRSHAVLIITVTRSQKVQQMGVPPTLHRGKLLLVDLAGSERQKSTGSSGQTLEEAKFINMSLTTLGKCINSLVDTSQGGHVPYRESKLTRLLKDSFGGSARTSLVVCVGPSSLYWHETSNTVKFGQRAIKIENNVRKRELIDYKALCRQQQQQVDLLTSALENAEANRDEVETELVALQAVQDKHEELEEQRNKQNEELMTQLQQQQNEMETQKAAHRKELKKAQDGLTAQLESLQAEIQERQSSEAEALEKQSALQAKLAETNELARKNLITAEQAREQLKSVSDQQEENEERIRQEAEKLASAKEREAEIKMKDFEEKIRQAEARAAAQQGKEVIKEVVKEVVKEVPVPVSPAAAGDADARALREKKLENVLMILQKELIDLKTKIDDMELKHKQEVTACHQSWQQRLMYEMKAKEKQIEYLQKTLEGCKAALQTHEQGVNGTKKGGRGIIDKILGRKPGESDATPTRFVRLCSMFNPTVESSPKWVEEVKADVCSSCSIFGQVEDVRVDTHNPKGLIYIAFGNPKTAHRAVVAIKGHLGDITYEFMSESMWRDYVSKLSEAKS
ncbi:hypothetical protein CYMTET_19189 [Cymbomonas tetramitiformis]|uniref:Kinesin-like protein n=1 Tax=Cymbomonas tetramitiformis TaxID=36881 RepID=A0AAE0G732_9CHLO|nr:hypothetical protein CYMTET_19189 [Cymbomonas tetramitiformis]